MRAPPIGGIACSLLLTQRASGHEDQSGRGGVRPDRAHLEPRPRAPRVGAAFPGTDGKIVYERQASTTQTDVLIAESDGSNAQAIASEGFVRNLDPVISPDGTKVLYVSSSGGSFQIWQMNSDGSNKVPLVMGSGINEFSAPAWSPDMKVVVFAYAGDLYRYRFSDKQFLQLTNGGLDGRPQYSPDGAKIALDRYSENPSADIYQNDIFVMNADGSGQTNITNTSVPSTADDDEFGPTWSPDGTRIAFWAIEGDSEIFAINADGSNQVNLTQSAGDEIEPAWSPDGTADLFVDLHFSNDGVNQSRLAYVQATGVPTPTFITDAIAAGNPDWGPADGGSACAASAATRGKGDPDPGCDWVVNFTVTQNGVQTKPELDADSPIVYTQTAFKGSVRFTKKPKPQDFEKGTLADLEFDQTDEILLPDFSTREITTHFIGSSFAKVKLGEAPRILFNVGTTDLFEGLCQGGLGALVLKHAAGGDTLAIAGFQKTQKKVACPLNRVFQGNVGESVVSVMISDPQPVAVPL